MSNKNTRYTAAELPNVPEKCSIARTRAVPICEPGADPPVTTVALRKDTNGNDVVFGTPYINQ
jgi:hypothetical protein